MPLSRRHLLQSLAASAAVTALPRRAWAAGPTDRNFLFLTCFGGWDPTRTFAPAFDNPIVNMEDDAEPLTLGDLTVVDHPSRPGVRSFFERHADQLAVVHGVLVPSVAHMACLELARTGYISGHPDWAAIIARHNGGSTPLPHLAVSGPSYPAQLAAWSARAGSGGQLAGLIDGSLLDRSDQPVLAPTADVAALQAALVANRRDATLARTEVPRRAALLDRHATTEARVDALRAASDNVTWQSSGAFPEDCLLAVELLAAGLSRCVSVAHPSLWDSHSENEIYQNILWTDAFHGLDILMQAMADTPGQQGGSVADETIVVFMSEMGRAPRLNMNNGKDHWPHASMMMWGPGVRGGRAYGAYDANFAGDLVDLGTGDASASGQVLTCASVGATLMALGDVDPAEYVTDPVLQALLA
jgi:uncharacterized protein (DUF1501 family)